MKIMKLANGSDTAERHFQESHARGVVNILGREARCGRVHRLAPGPETVRSIAGAILRSPSQHSLKSMRVSIDHTRQHRPAWQANSLLIGQFIMACDFSYEPVRIAHQGQVDLK